MAQFQYITQGGQPATFEAADPSAALAALPTNALPNSGIRMMQAPTAPTAPVVTPTKNSDGAVSSNDVTTSLSTNKAMNGAAGALTPPLPPPPTQIKGIDYAKQLKDSTSALKGSFDATLASQNQQYGEMFKQLEGQHQNASQAGAALAAQLNPYSDPRISSATGGYQQTIDQKYAAQAQSLRGQLNAAQAQLQAGYQENYIRLVQDAQEKQQKFQMDMQDYGLQLYNSVKQAQQFEQSQTQEDSQFEKTNALGVANYNLNAKERAFDNVMSIITTQSGSPKLQSDINSYLSGKEASPSVQAIIKAGADANMSDQEVLGFVQNQTDKLRQQQAALEAAASRQTNAQSIQFAQQSAYQAAAGSGQPVGSMGYAVAGARGAVGGSQPDAALRSYFTNVAVFAQKADGLKSELDNIAKNSQVQNALNSYLKNPFDPSIQTYLSQQMPIAYMYASLVLGQGGRSLSDRDLAAALQAIGTGAQDATTRGKIYNNILSDVKTGVAGTLSSAAFSGVAVQPFAASAETLGTKIDSLVKTPASSSGLQSKYPGLIGLP